MASRSYYCLVKEAWKWVITNPQPIYPTKLLHPINSLSFSLLAQLSQSSGIEEQNIFLMGPPGAGKTTVGRIIGCRLGLPVIDVDDILKEKWKMPVAKKLSEVGSERFLEEEGEALSDFSAISSVISLSGSIPLHSDTMQRLKSSGVVVYLDVDTADIMQRLSRLKVNRIVGQGPDASMRDILQYRQQFYNRWFDTRVLCGSEDTADEVAGKVLEALRRYHDSESEAFISTRGCLSKGTESASQAKYFSDIIIEGLAPDGGLYVPDREFPKLETSDWLRIVGMSYPERAATLLEKCIHPLDVAAAQLYRMVHKAYGGNFACASIAPVKHLINNQYVLELFHGPTASFKDLALQLMPQLFAYCLPQMCNYLILVATSGDAGSAVLNGFSSLSIADRQRVCVLVFFPEKRVSEIQKLQMTCFEEGSARAVGVSSDFDFCQRALKQLFGDSGLTGHLAVEYATILSTANSINWACLLPQVVYHCSSYLDLVSDGVVGFGDPVDLCMPTGNFGNAMSALYAKQMGIPIRKLICASNRNNVMADFIATGEYDLRGRPLVPTDSPAIDILKSSNLERLLFHASNRDGQLIQDLFSSLEKNQYFKVPVALLERIQHDILAGWCSEAECLAAIREVHSRTGYILDPHTAVAKVVADRLQDRTCPVVISSTVHHGKFAPTVLRALELQDPAGTPLDHLGRLSSFKSRPLAHNALMKCLRESGSKPYPVCSADVNILVEQVEIMIQASFCKVY